MGLFWENGGGEGFYGTQGLQCNSNRGGGPQLGRVALFRGPSPSPLLKSQKRAGGMAEVVECLPCKCDALSSNPNNTKKKKKKKPNGSLTSQASSF
jgi:hypothetical protein